MKKSFSAAAGFFLLAMRSGASARRRRLHRRGGFFLAAVLAALPTAFAQEAQVHQGFINGDDELIYAVIKHDGVSRHVLYYFTNDVHTARGGGELLNFSSSIGGEGLGLEFKPDGIRLVLGGEKHLVAWKSNNWNETVASLCVCAGGCGGCQYTTVLLHKPGDKGTGHMPAWLNTEAFNTARQAAMRQNQAAAPAPTPAGNEGKGERVSIDELWTFIPRPAVQEWLDRQSLGIGEKRSMTLMHIAAAQGRVDVMTYLKNMGMSIHERDYVGDTPLHAAVSFKQPDAAKWLINQGANANAKNNMGMTPQEARNMADLNAAGGLGAAPSFNFGGGGTGSVSGGRAPESPCGACGGKGRTEKISHSINLGYGSTPYVDSSICMVCMGRGRR